MKKVIALVAAATLVLAASPAFAKKSGNPKWDQDGNGFPDSGVVVNGHFTSLYAYDASGAYYWDLGDGRVYTSLGITSVDGLDQATLDVCEYVNNYSGSFENDPYQDTGWIENHITCKGYSGTEHYNYLIVNESDPRYTGNPEWAEWGNWEYHVLTVSGFGNLVNPYTHNN